MKVVLYTQYMENYGAHDWDGVGKCPQHWKMKGGSTFVVGNLTADQARNAIEAGLTTLRSLIEYSNESCSETVVDVKVLDDDAVVGDDWETPIQITFVGGRCIASEVEENGEYGHMRREIRMKRATWVMLPAAYRADYKCEYVLVDGRIVSQAELADALGV